MLPLETKAEFSNWVQPALLKVADLAEFAAGAHPVERLILDLRGLDLQSASPALLSLPWAGFLAADNHALPDQRPGLYLLDDQRIVQPGDVVETHPQRGRVSVRYRRGDNANVLFATERCNSYCLMCSQPPRQIADDWRVQQLCELIQLIDRNEPSLAISGGEPTLLGGGLAHVVGRCAIDLPQTHLHILSNGRRCSEANFADQFRDLHPSLSWGIPLYGDHYRLHDYIVQSRGAFAETIRGLYALEAAGQHIEIRVVLVRPTVERLREIMRFIHRNLPFVEHVALMGIEPIGFAKANHGSLWIDPADYSDTLVDAVSLADRRGLAVSLYNLPLCTVPRSLWPFARRSISNWKQNYLPACDPCVLKERCSGFFSWVTPDWTSRAIAPVTEDSSCLVH
ncbi:His-Xaa-Ser system radical SAM maturase HxsC [Luteimonas sp. RD2P54]|uniref:His-Xaa-Ser system radical SAM maturase HxsC n=1 Tax=Luteimonas endophytica TaxID=3042023 RepID=A0ABT6JDZ8_9GAMM|nr:His-Xaa-Ser system radical SAM maturase HxsC [Luteimonas endophytica]MDH5824959.1 His-Xaa-Ser system radical SAM maturase HxsC [Luteimonas endophytica]